MLKTCQWAGMLALAALWAAPAGAQISTTTTTKGTSVSKTKTDSWQSPDGNQRKTNTVTHTNSKSKSKSVTVNPPDRGLTQAPVASGRGYRLDGAWQIQVGRSGCSLTIYRGHNSSGGGATTSGCVDRDLADVGNWMTSADGGSLTLTKMLVVPVASLHRTGLHRFDGTLSSGRRITVWR